MATTVEKFVSACQEIVDAKPAYVKNKSNLKECDCIGMDKYAFRKCGVSFSSTGSNYTVRKQVDNLRYIRNVGDLAVGDVVFKSREPGEQYYDLPKHYQVGGADYNGDLRDYYHIGTVKSVSPLRIMHMTDPTAKEDDSLGKWSYASEWKPEYVHRDEPVPEPEPEPVPEPEPILPDTAIVWADNGKPVNLRKRPSRAAALVERVPCYESVNILEEGPDWCYVKWGNKVGYMMTEFLILPDETICTVIVRHLTSEQAKALAAMYPDSEVIEEGDSHG